MPNRLRKETAKKPRTEPESPTTVEESDEPDANQTAYAALQAVIAATEGTGKDPVAVMLGRRGGLKGGRSRAERLSPAERSESARKAALARWNKRKT